VVVCSGIGENSAKQTQQIAHTPLPERQSQQRGVCVCLCVFSLATSASIKPGGVTPAFSGKKWGKIKECEEVLLCLCAPLKRSDEEERRRGEEVPFLNASEDERYQDLSR